MRYHSTVIFEKDIPVSDHDGHLIEIGEPLEVFVGNMGKKELSETQISEKTGIPADTVHKLLYYDK